MPKRSPERLYRNRICKHTNAAKVYYWPINDSYRAGIPDHWYSGTADCLWVEYKWYPKDRFEFHLTAGNNPKLTALQAQWLSRRYDEGRNVWVVVGMPSGGVILRNKAWEEPYKVEAFLSDEAVAAEIINLTMLSS